MKIAMIGHKQVPNRSGGVEVVVEELSREISSMGHQVVIYNRGKLNKIIVNNFCIENNIRIVAIPTPKRSSLNALIYSILATFHAITQNYDVIHYHAEGPSAMCWLPKLFGIRVIVTNHGLDWQRSKWGGLARKYLLFGEKISAQFSDELIVLSKKIAEYFFEEYEKKTIFIPNGVRETEYMKASLIKNEWGLEKDEYILFLARLVPEKGLHYLINAYKNLKTKKKLVIAGEGIKNDGYSDSLKDRYKHDPQIIFVGHVSGQLYNELFSNSYLYVLPSEVEGMPLSLLEAMSFGNAVLVSDIAENLDVVRDSGLSFKCGDIEDLNDKLEHLIENRSLVNEMKKKSRDSVKKRYNWKKIATKTLQVYKGETLVEKN
ncbi:glycosyltransferase family 4 protein [Enterococcus pallens]|uniref:Glycosyltransferase n=1 Tax=Enterococcus pallens ATCC BAA-351 TaxID=1158607 RepID=R2T3V5_9ENTE|nr:glycosyltransferase family 4 protein [Enterococcus pallens]EOH94899.1 hypothetical protein UAU_01821 [Enterococcus pallens ATCC BAA-351]EOU14782.1 hypothetical protein I588_04432 [Enterococcus pallens ATCC BAA-351]OJG77183.1 hypothetical protein RV10_GL002922 [Enterococcus pallens]